MESVVRYLRRGGIVSQNPFQEIRIQIDRQTESKIRALFENIVRVSVRDLVDDRLSALGFSGTSITETLEWKRPFYDLEGKASSIAVRHRGYWIMISSRGIILSLSANVEKVKEEIVYEVIEKLHRVGAIKIVSS